MLASDYGQWVELRQNRGKTVLVVFFPAMTPLSLLLLLLVNHPEPTELQLYMVSIDGRNPFIKWQLEKGLDWTISSVLGESYRVDVSSSLDLSCFVTF